jgi:hypothetical protein
MGDGDSIYTERSVITHSHSSVPGERTLDAIIKDRLNIIDDRNDPPTLDDTLPELTDEELEVEVEKLEAELQAQLSTRNLGDTTTFATGMDYKPVRTRIIPNTHSKASQTDTAIYIAQDVSGVSISLETLRKIVDWAEGK